MPEDILARRGWAPTRDRTRERRAYEEARGELGPSSER